MGNKRHPDFIDSSIKKFSLRKYSVLFSTMCSSSSELLSCQYLWCSRKRVRLRVSFRFLPDGIGDMASMVRCGFESQMRMFLDCSGRAAMPVVEASRVDRYSKDDIIVSPSILSANFARLGEQVSILSAHCSLFLNKL
jgi:hypothetical protein